MLSSLQSAFAADTGRIRCVLKDTAGEAVMGANVVVLNSQPARGAASDLDGNVLIAQVPIGNYTLKITCLGYHELMVENVVVIRDVSQDLGVVTLTPNTMELEDVVITAKTGGVVVGQASQTIGVSSEQIERMATTDATSIVAAMPGFKVDAEGKIHARGGRSDETKYVINGVSVDDPLVGGAATFVNLDVANIEQLDVLSGGFGPEYGQAQAAVVKVSTKEGDNDAYHGKIEWQTDNLLDDYSFNTDGVSLTFGGPLPFQGSKPAHERVTFFFSGRGYLTDTYLPYDVDRGSSDYLDIGIDLPERQKNEYQVSLNLAIPIGTKSKLKVYGEQFYRKWDLYPEGEAVSGNYGYPYLYNEDYRPRAKNERSAFSLTYSSALSQNSSLESVLYRSRTYTLITPAEHDPDDFTLEYPDNERAQEDAKSAFLGYQDYDGNGFFDGYVDANNNGAYDGFYYDGDGNPVYSEGYEDVNRNGVWDPGEEWVDLNGNGVYDAAEPYTNVPNATTGENNIGYDPWDPYVDMNGNGRWDDAEPQTPEQDTNHNGVWDGERFQDANGNGIWDGWTEPFTDANGNGVWDEGEEFTDSNGNGVWDMAEGYDDMDSDGRIDFQDVRDTNEDLAEPFLDGDFYYDTGEPFVDQPDPVTGVYNGVYDAGEQFYDLPSTSGAYSIWLANGAVGTPPSPTLNGVYDGPNFIFDEYELFARYASFVTEPFSRYYDELQIRGVAEAPDAIVENQHYRGSVVDVSMPVIYGVAADGSQAFSLEAHGSDWPSGSTLYELGLSGATTWGDRSNRPGRDGMFDPPNQSWEEWEPFEDYNGNGLQDGATVGNFPVSAAWGFQYNTPDYYDFFLNPYSFDAQALWQERESITYSWKTEYQVQANRFHDLLGGFELLYRDMEMNSIEEPQIPYDGLVELKDDAPYPDRGGKRDFYHRKPWEGAIYFRDRMEFEGLNVLIGLRWDFLLHEDSYVSETAESANAGDPGAVEAERRQSRLSPRLGISHPITDTAKLYFNYGHFYQAPNYQFYYAQATGARANNIIVGNPNLKYQKTVEYQFGVEAELPDLGTTVNVQGYYRDIFDQITTTSEEVQAGYFIDKYTNGDYGRSRGVNFAVERYSRHTSFNANYELSFAYGKASSAQEASESRIAGQVENREEHPLAWDQTHSINASWSLYYDKGEHPELFGLHLPDDWMLYLSTSYGSGLPYTPSKYSEDVDNSAEVDINSQRMSWTEVTDLKFEKYFSLGASQRHRFTVGFEIRNLFNKHNVRSVYSATGSTYLATHGMDEDYALYYPAKNTYDANPRNYGSGRQVLLKLGYRF